MNEQLDPIVAALNRIAQAYEEHNRIVLLIDIQNAERQQAWDETKRKILEDQAAALNEQYAKAYETWLENLAKEPPLDKSS
jgi:hypothetical protein